MLRKLLIVPALVLAASLGASVAMASAVFSVGITPVIVTQNGPAATPNVTLATIRMNAVGSTDDILVSALPLSMTASNGGTVSNLNNCRVVNLSNNSQQLNSGSNIPSSIFNGSNSITLDTPLRVPAGSIVDVAVKCNIIASAAVNNTYAVNIDPLAVVARSAVNGLQITPSVGTGAPVQTGVVTTSSAGTVIIPGLPNTGMGGNTSTNVALIAFAGLVTAAGGYAAVRRTR